MKNFVRFSINGVTYLRDSKGKPIGIKEPIKESGIIKSTPSLYGDIFRRFPQLSMCDKVSIRTFTIS